MHLHAFSLAILHLQREIFGMRFFTPFYFFSTITPFFKVKMVENCDFLLSLLFGLTIVTMSMLLSKKIIPAILIMATILSIGCSSAERYITIEGEALGTFVQLKCSTTEQESAISNMIAEVDDEAKASMSIFNPDSRIARLNNNETDSLDKHIAYNIELAGRFTTLSDGAYDITIKPLTDVWGFGRKDATINPNIDSILTFVGYDKISIDGMRLHKSDPRVQIDLNSIAKGYVVDMIATRLEAMGIVNYMVNIGGEIRCRGKNNRGTVWSIGIETPYDGNMSMDSYEKIIEIEDAAVATSGNYRRFYLTEDGRKVAHTIDPRNGYSAVSNLLSVTIIAPTCAEADAAATMFMSLGSEGNAVRLAQWCEREYGWKYYFIFAGDEEYDIACSKIFE